MRLRMRSTLTVNASGAGEARMNLTQPLLIYSRFDLNRMLLERAERAGAAMEQTRVMGIEQKEKGWRLRVHGIASIDHADPLLADCPGAQFIVRIKIREIFGNCPRYIHRYELVERSQFVPRKGRETPVPDWMRGEWNDVLPTGHPAHNLTRTPGASHESPRPSKPDPRGLKG